MPRDNHLDQLGPRAIGRRGKPTPRSTPDQCDYKIGATTKPIYVKRKNPKPTERKVAQIWVIEGGKQCTNPSLVTKQTGERRCVEHLTAEYKQKSKE